MAINIYLNGSPGGLIKIKVGNLLLKYNFINISFLKINVHIAGAVLTQNNELRNYLQKKNNVTIIGYQHGGGAAMDIDDQNEYLKYSDEFRFWSVANPNSIHRWGYGDKIKFLLNNIVKKGQIKLVLPCISCDVYPNQIMINQNNLAKKLIQNKFDSIPENWTICRDPRDCYKSIRLEKKSCKQDIYIFIGIPSTFIWYCIKFNIDFYIIDDGSFEYIKKINFKNFKKEAIEFVKYLENRIIKKNEKNLYNFGNRT